MNWRFWRRFDPWCQSRPAACPSTGRCYRRRGHDGLHENHGGITWSDEEAAAA